MIAVMDPIAETYQDVQKLIHHAAHRFQRAHGGEMDEMVSVANLTFMKAFISHDESKASFITWFHIKMNKAFLELWRGNCRRAHDPLPEVSVKPDRAFCELLLDLSHDARTIVELLLELPDTLQENILEKGPAPLHVKPALRIYLKTFFGWSDTHVLETFREIAEVVNG